VEIYEISHKPTERVQPRKKVGKRGMRQAGYAASFIFEFELAEFEDKDSSFLAGCSVEMIDIRTCEGSNEFRWSC
jgi:hypothetical protein